MKKQEKLSDEKLLQELSSRLQVSSRQEQQISELSLTIKELSQKLNESESLKSHFISNISNELVNPFTSILAIAGSNPSAAPCSTMF